MAIWIQRPHAVLKRSGVRLPLYQNVPALVLVVVVATTVPLAKSQNTGPYPSPVVETGEIRTLPATDVDRIALRDLHDRPSTAKKISPKDESCLLPPLNLTSSPVVAAEQLQIAPKARREYQEACLALQKKQTAEAEKHLRKAVHEYPKYSAAWVTLGQVLAVQERIDDARKACFEGSTADPIYVPAYLCLADLAARAHDWGEALKLSNHALALDPSNNAVAYEYHAAANLHLHNLGEAEKSGLRAVEIDKEHRDPRVYFVLAQIYEAKGDAAHETEQLREYLKYASSLDDIALVKQFLSRLEKPSPGTEAVAIPPRSATGLTSGSLMRSLGPADIDDAVPPVLNDGTCPLPQILKQTSSRTEDLIDNLQRFSAKERIEHIEIDRNGKRRSSTAEVVDYVAQIKQNSSGYPSVGEYRFGSSGTQRASLTDSGTAAFALIFHPTHVGNFEFRCEGLTELRGSPAWQVHFEEGADPNQSFTAIMINGSIYLPRFKGRAWIATNSYDVLRIETDLVAPIPQIDLQLEHMVINYAPVGFQDHHIQLWLPESASLYIAYRGHRYERVHNFGQFQLFSVDTSQAIKEPIASQDGPLQ